MPGPLEDIVPAEATTRCHGTGGWVFGERNLRAAISLRELFGRIKAYLDPLVWNASDSRLILQCGLEHEVEFDI